MQDQNAQALQIKTRKKCALWATLSNGILAIPGWWGATTLGHPYLLIAAAVGSVLLLGYAFCWLWQNRAIHLTVWTASCAWNMLAVAFVLATPLAPIYSGYLILLPIGLTFYLSATALRSYET